MIFVRKPVRLNKTVSKNVISNVVNKPIYSVNASETCFPMTKCKNNFSDLWKHFIILILLVTLGIYLFNNIGDCFLKVNVDLNDLSISLLFSKHDIYGHIQKYQTHFSSIVDI